MQGVVEDNYCNVSKDCLMVNVYSLKGKFSHTYIRLHL